MPLVVVVFVFKQKTQEHGHMGRSPFHFIKSVTLGTHHVLGIVKSKEIESTHQDIQLSISKLIDTNQILTFSRYYPEQSRKISTLKLLIRLSKG